MKKKTKRPTISSVKKKAWDVFSRFVRTRDCLLTTGSSQYGECFTCSETLPFVELQAGHFVPKHSGNYFSEKGVHAQCRTCNIFGKNRKRAGMPLEYRRHLVELYGEKTTAYLERENQLERKFTIPELEELYEYYKNKLKELEE